jgi:hypothetical protein
MKNAKIKSLGNDEYEIRVGEHVAYYSIGRDFCAPVSAPTEKDADAVATWVDSVELDLIRELITDSLYEDAMARVRSSDSLAKFEDYIFQEWPEGDEHWIWIASADEAELLSWAESLRNSR